MRLQYLDFLRFVAAILVLAQHLFENAFEDFFLPFLSLGPGIMGVVLFFFISGYVIPFSVRNRFSIGSFVTRRIFRLYPAYAFTLALILAGDFLNISSFAGTFAKEGIAGVISNLFFLPDFTGHTFILGVAWTLALEIAWYVTFLVIFLIFGFSRIFTLAVLASLGLLILSGLSIVMDVRLPFGRIGMLNAAMVGYAACAMHQGWLSRQRYSQVFAIFLVAMFVSQYVAFGVFQHPTVSLFNSLMAWSIAAAIFGVFMLSDSAQKSKIANSESFAWLGMISYSIYLVHAVVLMVLVGQVNEVTLLILTPILTILVSALMFYYVEKPGMQIGKKLAGKFQVRPVPAPV